MSSTAAIIQARTGSTRLPGKILKELSGKPLLWHVHNRLTHSKKIDKVIIATTNLPEDNVVEEFCKKNNFLFSRGSSENVLSRYFDTAEKFEAETIVRITADCPVIDPVLVDNMLEKYFTDTGKFDYLSNSIERTFPRGLDTEIFSFKALKKSLEEATKDYEKEHVTPYIYQHPQLFSLYSYTNDKDYSFHRWTLDTKEDYLLIKEIFKNLYNEKKIFLWNDVINLFNNKPELIDLNKNIKQKDL